MENKLKTAEEIIDQYPYMVALFKDDSFLHSAQGYQAAIHLMKEYAKQMIDAQLKVAADEAKLKYDHYDDMAAYVDKSSILNCTRIELK